MTVTTTFTRLTTTWNAEPNCPEPVIIVEGDVLVLSFFLNPYRFKQFDDGDWARIEFGACWRYRLGGTNDEGWYRGQCRFSKLAPGWGEFYELHGDLLEEQVGGGWTAGPVRRQAVSRHFLFYFRDETFECDAATWGLKVVRRVEHPRGRPTTG